MNQVDICIDRQVLPRQSVLVTMATIATTDIDLVTGVLRSAMADYTRFSGNMEILQLLTSVISCQYILNTGVKYDENLLLKYPYLCHLSPLVPVGLSLAISKNTALE